MIKRLIAMVFVLSLMLSSFAVAGGSDSDLCVVSEKADYKDLRSEFYDMEDDFFHYRSEYKVSLMDHDSERQNLNAFRLQNLDDDLDDLADDVRDLKEDVEDAEDCASKEDLLDDLRDLKNDINDVRDEITEVLAEGKSMAASNVAINEYGWKEAVPAPTPTAAAQQSDVVVSTLNAGPSQPTSAVTATVTVDKTLSSSWDQGRQTVWLVAGVIVLLAVVIFLLGMLFRR
ncbi:hypothetical protein HYT55_02750 [Candidatus Woesearchaeota archaeon]|nr:hypothetical protein [Candidatus Woesearchaeota archaeon]